MKYEHKTPIEMLEEILDHADKVARGGLILAEHEDGSDPSKEDVELYRLDHEGLAAYIRYLLLITDKETNGEVMKSFLSCDAYTSQMGNIWCYKEGECIARFDENWWNSPFKQLEVKRQQITSEVKVNELTQKAYEDGKKDGYVQRVIEEVLEG